MTSLPRASPSMVNPRYIPFAQRVSLSEQPVTEAWQPLRGKRHERVRLGIGPFIALIYWVSGNRASQRFRSPHTPLWGPSLAICLSVSPLASKPMQLGATCCSSLVMLKLLKQL
jgi:hypothetical protein